MKKLSGMRIEEAEKIFPIHKIDTSWGTPCEFQILARIKFIKNSPRPSAIQLKVRSGGANKNQKMRLDTNMISLDEDAIWGCCPDRNQSLLQRRIFIVKDWCWGV